MNSTLLTSDRMTHLKICMTALFAAALVVTVGLCAKPADGRQGQNSQTVAASAFVIVRN
jgi:hypothetical protein